MALPVLTGSLEQAGTCGQFGTFPHKGTMRKRRLAKVSDNQLPSDTWDSRTHLGHNHHQHQHGQDGNKYGTNGRPERQVTNTQKVPKPCSWVFGDCHY